MIKGPLYISSDSSQDRQPMKRVDFRRISTVALLLFPAAGIQAAPDQPKEKVDLAQVLKWSADDLDFFLHGSTRPGKEIQTPVTTTERNCLPSRNGS